MTKKRKARRTSPTRSLLHRQHRWFGKVVKIVWISVLVIVLSMPLYVFLVIQNPFNLFGAMPGLKEVENPQNDLSSELISADGVSLGRYFRFNRSQVSFDQLPEQLVKTLLISEDHRFYDHSGMDFWSYLRVMYGIVSGNPQGGGSTLTQQTAKNLFSTRGEELQGRLARLGGPVELVISKTKEWIIAIQLEQNFTKEEIIAMYLNTVPFNNNAFGIKVAAETYFQKRLDELSLTESALLVGMLQGTYRFNPVSYPERALNKRNQVLYKLYKHEYITRDTYDSLKELPLQLNFGVPNHNTGLATYFRRVVERELLTWCREQKIDLYESGLKIYTTIDSRLQLLAEAAMEQQMKYLQKEFDHRWGDRSPWVDDSGREIENFLERKIKQTDTYRELVKRYGEGSDSVRIMLNRKRPMKVFSWEGEKDVMFSPMDSLRYYNRFLHSGLMAMNPQTGEVKAWVGGINFKYFQFDHVKQSKRQPGSTFKAFVYGKAIEDGFSPCYVLRDISPSITIDGKIYHPRNADGTYGSGEAYTLRQGMAKSLNSITIQMLHQLTPQNVVSFAHRLGINSELDPVYSLGLGTSPVSLYEMVGAYCSFVNLGLYTEPYVIARIEDRHGNVIANFVPKIRQAMNELTAYKMVYMLRGGVEEEGGTSGRLSPLVTLNNEVGGKTGTTDNASDGWYIGITHNLVTGVWVGGDEPSIHFPSWGFGSGSNTALPMWDIFMRSVYSHPELGISKGAFRQPSEKLDVALPCPDDDQDMFNPN